MYDKNPNQHITDYLDYYLNRPSTAPRFAVMLSGAWGIGKTHFITEYLKKVTDKKYAYISLYGLSSFEEIDDALLAALAPFLSSNSAQAATKVMGRIAGTLIKGALEKYIGTGFGIEELLEPKLKAILDKTNADLFIFDDLERCELPINRVLGYINQLVEHEGRNVILLANQEELAKDEEYSRIHEKLIGKTFSIQSTFDQACRHFIANMPNEKFREFLESQIKLIEMIYQQSGFNNLRLLQQNLWDFQRFYLTFTEKHRDNNLAMEQILSLLFALAFELKAGNLCEADLTNRKSAIINSYISTSDKAKNTEPIPLAIVQKKYHPLDLANTALSDGTLINLLINGIVDAKQIHLELDASSWFVDAANEPAWRTVWHYFERMDEEVSSALSEMERTFAAREYTEIGEILHVFGIRLRMAKIGALPQEIETVVTENKQYIDDLYQSQQLEPLNPNRMMHPFDRDAAYALGITERDNPNFKALDQYLIKKQKNAYRDQYANFAKQLLKDMQSDIGQALHKIDYVYNSPNFDYQDIPVLAYIPEEEFVSIFLSLHPREQRETLRVISDRHNRSPFKDELSEEKSWILGIKTRLFTASTAMNPIAKYRLNCCLDHFFPELNDPGV